MPPRVKNQIADDWDAYYRRYQFDLAAKYLIPALVGWGVKLDGQNFLEIGCGDGGCGAAFHGMGCRVVMMDIEERLVALARVSNEKEGIDIKTFAGDVFDESGPFYQEGPFDLVMFRDVMEHLEDPVRALEIVRRHLTPTGAIFVVFPPYYSPYGAHQQILPRKRIAFLPYNKLPYLQLLPAPWFRWIVRGDAPPNREVERLSGVRLTIGRFEKSAKRAGLSIQRKKLYLSRPTFALRYGLPVVGASVLGAVPLLRELVVTAGYYLLERARRETDPAA